MESKKDLLAAIHYLYADILELQFEAETPATRRRWTEIQRADQAGGDSLILAFKASFTFYKNAIPALVELGVGTPITWMRDLLDKRDRPAACVAALADLERAKGLLCKSGSRVSRATETELAEYMAKGIALMGMDETRTAAGNRRPS